MAMPTNGNAGAAMAAYCSRAGIEAYVFCPDDTPAVNVREIAMQGAEVFLVDGLIDDCGRLVAEGEKAVGWFNCSTLREPYRIEGKKTMGIELAEQLGWQLPDVIFYPTGGGTGIIGMWKAFAELETIGWIGAEAAAHGRGPGGRLRADGQGLGGRRRARAALAERAYLRGRHSRAASDRRFSDPARGARERRVRNRRRRRCDRARMERGCGRGRAAPLSRGLLRPMRPTNRRSADGRVGPDERVVLFNCASGLKYPMPEAGTRLKLGAAIDWRTLLAAPPGSISRS